MATSKIETLIAEDPVLARIIMQVALPPLPETRGVFYDLVSCIVDQQITHRSRNTYLKKVIHLLGGDEPDAKNVFQIEEDDWIRNKLARHKYDTLLRLADHWNENGWEKLDWDTLTDSEIKQWITSIKGIGPQTADLILLFTLQRPGVFPVNDYHLKIVMEKVYDLNPDQKLVPQLKEIAARWGSQQSLATRYLLAYKELMSKKI